MFVHCYKPENENLQTPESSVVPLRIRNLEAMKLNLTNAVIRCRRALETNKAVFR